MLFLGCSLTLSPGWRSWRDHGASLVAAEMPFSWIHAQEHAIQPRQFSKLICEFLCIPRVLWRTLEIQPLLGKYYWNDIYYAIFTHLILVAWINVQEIVLHLPDCEFTKVPMVLSTCVNSFFTHVSLNILWSNSITSFNFIIYWLIIWMYITESCLRRNF